MKKLMIVSLAALAISVPAQAGLLSGAGLLNVAKIVLNGKAVLNKGQSTCGAQLGILPQDNLLMDAASGAVQKLLPVAKYSSLLSLANKDANVAAMSPTFCDTTTAKKPGILGGIADAAGKLGVGGKLGGIGGAVLNSGVLGGGTAGTTAGTATGTATTGTATGTATGGGGVGQILKGVLGQ